MINSRIIKTFAKKNYLKRFILIVVCLRPIAVKGQNKKFCKKKVYELRQRTSSDIFTE